MLKLRLLLISIIAIVGFFIAPVAVKGQTVILSLEPSSSSYTVGDSFNIVIKLDTGSSNTDGVDIHYLNYNPLLLEAQTVLPGALYANTNTNNIDAVNGRIDFSQTSAGGATFNGQGTLATITFKALSQGTANLTFSFTLGSTIDTNVAFLGQDVLSNVVNSSYTLVVPDITPPTGCVVKINNDAAAASSTSVFLTVSGCTDASGMDQMKFSNNGIDG
ncbi:hypothetical protein COT20_02345, partial [bacterium (Candidatus Gribaldobacteria) CG08_land_8_20_14_0_20_39_15]